MTDTGGTKIRYELIRAQCLPTVEGEVLMVLHVHPRGEPPAPPELVHVVVPDDQVDRLVKELLQKREMAQAILQSAPGQIPQ